MKAALASLLGVALIVLAGAQPVYGRASTGNAVVFWGGNSDALFATFSGGQLQGKFVANGAWSAVALTSSSFAMYRKSTGRLLLGYVVDGTPTFTAKKNIATGYTTVVGDCDGVFFYNKNTGVAFTATLGNGVMGTKHFRTMAKGLDLGAASCDTLYLQDQGNSEQTFLFYNGKLSSKVTTADKVVHSLLAATGDSLLRQDSTAGGNGEWGVMGMGVFTQTGSLPDFAQWDAIAGTASEILYYRSTGQAAYATLAGGSYSFQGQVSGVTQSGFTHVVGGK